MKKLLALIIVALMLTMTLASCDLSWLPIEIPGITTTPTPESHKCESICPECGKCLDAECVEDACKDKCEGHEPPACEHVYDNACDADCNVCGAEREVGEHAYDNACDADCNVCGAEREVGEHAYDNACDADCNVCGAEREVAEHQYDEVVTAPTCFAAGYTTHTCTECGKNYTDTPTAQLTHVDADGDEKCDHGCGTDIPKPRYEVSFNTDGAGNIEPQTIKEGETATDPVTPVKQGYTFLGWYIGDAKYDFATPVTANIALVAKWQANTYTLILGESKLTVTYGQAVGELPAVPSVEGKKDGKWMLDGAELTAETVYNFAEDKEATAEYADITFTVTFKDGETDRGTFTVKYGTVMAPPALSGVNNNQYMYWAVDGQPYSFSAPVKSDLTIEVVRKSLVAPHYDVEVGSGQLVMDLALLGDNAWFGEVSSVRAHGVEAEFTVDGSKLSISEDALLVGENAIVITNKDGAAYRFIAVKATMFIDEVADFSKIVVQTTATATAEQKAVYYIITKDLDLTGFKGIGGYAIGGTGIHHTFLGTLDGRNHKLSNYTAADNTGLFFYIQGTVKNIEFVNATSTGRGGVLATGILANSIVENITITGKIVRDATWYAQQHSILTGTIGAGVKLTNITIKCTEIQGELANVLIFGLANANGTKVVLTNCKVIRPESLASYGVFKANYPATITGAVEEVMLKNTVIDGYFDVEAGKGSYNVDLKDVISENIVSSTLGTPNGKVLALEESALNMGDNAIIITGESGNTYTITVTKATMFIDEVADFGNIVLAANNTTGADTSLYYVITKDIDLAGYTGTGGSGSFCGTLDGRNHKLMNYTSNDLAGLFWQIAGTIKNVEFTDAITTCRSGILATNILANAVIENVTITAKIVTHELYYTTQQHSLLSWTIGAGVKLTNVTINCTAIEANTSGNIAQTIIIVGLANANGTQVVLTNCKVTMPESLSGYTVFKATYTDRVVGAFEVILK